MRILLISTAFSGLTQRFYTELDDAGYDVSVELHLGNDAQLIEGAELFKPDLILCPYLTRRLPETLYSKYLCLIVHPGIKGDRGPSSLDWAIQERLAEWGVTLLAADREMDAGAIWAAKRFPLRRASKSSIFNREVAQCAVDCLWEAMTYLDSPHFRPEPLDYNRADVKGRLRSAMKQADRRIDWSRHTTAEILARIHAADGSPGVLDELCGRPFFLYNAAAGERFGGKPGEIVAVADGPICRATLDGSIWIGHLKPKTDDASAIKLPAATALADLLPKPQSGLSGWFGKSVKRIELDYTQPDRHYPWQEVWYEIAGQAAYLHFQFHNGGMSTEQCRLLLRVYQHVATLDVKAIVLSGGEDFWSNGIHLNRIEAAANPADESWDNINAIDDLILQIITTMDKLTVAAVAGNAGAGGAILALAPDKVFARDGVVFNPHYKNMGELYGSEYWTYLLPKRVGHATAAELTEQRLPLSARRAWHLGMVDKVLDRQHAIFVAQIRHSVNTLIADPANLQKMLAEKAAIRCRNEAIKPLAAYRKFELAQMHANFYGSDAYHQARKAFVFKKCDDKTADYLAKHRQPAGVAKAVPGSMAHCVWQDCYAMGDPQVDNQHKDFFKIADKLLAARNKDERLDLMFELYQHVKEHFAEEEALMKKSGFQHYPNHAKEHNLMLEKLMEMDKKIQHDQLAQTDLPEFIERWTKHIVNSDMAFSQHWKEMNVFSV
ncbi:enoyl-CoA hydratase-related protein [Methylomonas sp. SURF-1]|uniref:Enoyl-CoA hydratase-related protein n=1 Tax=Methylomonas aurea TaxID=2952224 RepID=A0ABT1UL36_9GAMM|nr:hemerythrin domain-containing protein [Methylomonas sp. SURF-1]MCQ8182939.1 enoyl-CoA hydratase-related protein [Methylomonas sp. SURF-1]